MDSNVSNKHVIVINKLDENSSRKEKSDTKEITNKRIEEGSRTEEDKCHLNVSRAGRTQNVKMKEDKTNSRYLRKGSHEKQIDQRRYNNVENINVDINNFSILNALHIERNAKKNMSIVDNYSEN